MEWLNQLQGRIVGLDTAPLIYFIEQNPVYSNIVRAFFQNLSRGEFHVVTSTLTLTEVLIHPLRSGNIELARQYREILCDREDLVILPVSSEIAEIAARLRATYNCRTPDAIQIATAMSAGAAFFFTNDTGLSTITEIEMLILDELRDRV